MDNQLQYTLLQSTILLSILFYVISRVSLIYKTIYKVPNKANSIVKYNIPNTR